jgi:hypothetical protein
MTAPHFGKGFMARFGSRNRPGAGGLLPDRREGCELDLQDGKLPVPIITPVLHHHGEEPAILVGAAGVGFADTCKRP